MHTFPLPLFPEAGWLKLFSETPEWVWNETEIFPKQTFRNRTWILSANGPLLLSIPVRKNRNTPFHEVEIAGRDWIAVWWKSIESAYRHAPYFDEIGTDIHDLLYSAPDSLFEFSFSTWMYFAKRWNWPEGNRNPELIEKYTAVIETPLSTAIYPQVFKHKHGFTPGMGSLDLIFNLGPQIKTYV